MELKAYAAVAALSLAGHSAALAITFDPFAPGGAGGTRNGQNIAIGAGGGVFELDAFLNIAGQDLNGGVFGTSAQLSIDPLPAGLDFAFTPSLSADASDLTLSYSFTNNTGMALGGVAFLSFLDAEIDEPVNGSFNEFAVTGGGLGVERSFEVDEPGFVFGDIFDNLLLGSLDGFNALPPGTPDDVSMALSFELGTLAAGDTVTVDVLISEDGDAIGGFSITQFDDSPSPTDITYSGAVRIAVVPLPAGSLLLAIGLAALAVVRRRA